jgi:hypothetical protein
VPPPAAHHYLIVGDFEVRQRFVAVHFDVIPGDVIALAGGFIDEVMVTFRICSKSTESGARCNRRSRPFSTKRSSVL